ncbi:MULTISPECIES: NADH-quinone oxidoreductase subunit C [Pelosinus]|jgi:NADH-quinone oxidoreductase subunit C|uniref:NAD(P)H dehydrogenase subunit J n=1 Tax=Pelosinus fermentans B4 TaxID=1149862 RepID=I9L834_9FIRM|nr:MULTISPECIES: NADH-quinone oxidoreductase subunit C [Pelosinus]MDF2570412.1 NAD(P)H-quinone oxidoreductase subunit [Sporomusa sp.]EIW16416.1 NADH dehydrogenase, subunit C [Pelosinus fermentans B4]EIW22603.1 NADH dehydrogenase, subunit C [Pelosinus fermentans A11]OAM95723.1 NADH dehydrogenase, subunit C [Pelosinus fermentans DSM 17108]SDR32040.1 NADH-quinone oxidoreductase subunit C [Pelosinus fermentans]
MSKQMISSELFLRLQAQFSPGVTIIGEHFQQALLVESEELIELLTVLKTDPNYQFNLLSNLTAVDYVEYFEVVYHLYSLPLKQSATIKTRCTNDHASVPSVTAIWPSADFQEREVYDLLGIRFTGHPNLLRILMPDDFPEHPLRKAYQFTPDGEKG